MQSANVFHNRNTTFVLPDASVWSTICCFRQEHSGHCSGQQVISGRVTDLDDSLRGFE
jgi:hypothetical protein